MSKAKFKNIVVMNIPGSITSKELMESLTQLIDEVKAGGVTGVLVDVSSLRKNNDRLKKIGEETGEWARKTIDPVLKKYKVKKIAFVSPSGKFHGRAKGSLPLVKKNAPTKHYFKNHTAAINWLHP